MSAAAVEHANVEMARVDEVLQRYRQAPSSLISVLEDLNEAFRYLPRPALERVSAALDVPMSQIYHVATFYKAFHLSPQGRHTVCVCEGTACHVKGAGKVMDALQVRLGVSEGGTSDDGQFTLRSVRCLGCCALAPAVMVDETVHGEVRPDQAATLLAHYRDNPHDA